jgi:hypothetical protein
MPYVEGDRKRAATSQAVRGNFRRNRVCGGEKIRIIVKKKNYEPVDSG